ncbi:hypothetical protein BH10ACT1_BH10ACT1_13480 [soil metagenome]
MVHYEPRTRPGFVVQAEVLTWELCVFRVIDAAGATVFVQRRGPAVEEFLRELDDGLHDGSLAAALARPPRRHLARPPRGNAWPGLHVGVEHEFRVLDATGSPLDVRTAIHDWGIDGVRADPADPNAYRCSWGGVITCDGPEVELATPPIPVRPGFVERVVESARSGRAAVEAVLPAGHALDGYSTHVNVSLRGRGSRRLARRYARTYAPALMLVLDAASSPGLLVRPRPGRLELGGEYAEGDHLRAAVAFAVGSTLAVRRSLGLAAVRCHLEPAIERYGWFVDRSAFGVDLYREAREATLQRRRRPVSAGAHLRDAWTRSRAALGGRASPADLEVIDQVVDGRRALRCELTT